ncbi:urease accessory protein UreF [Synechococcus sp. MIT S9504]|uniref:urease accessory protein UreF n=1 Tax=Synechococcus sp. MIT S9504 TaxID=1801628 RepID=UPI0007BC41BD|nr:urease accessory UreF family protein [Synechococcus sp. MIT S9504]KZR84770.1 Urease accessory protein UreF [Synechococcus sp. MIT S9504]
MTSLALLQMVSPALPVGAFSYSEGLEVLIQSGALRDEHGIELWLAAELQRGGLRLEAAALPELAADLRHWQASADASARTRVIDLDGWLLATREAAELRAQQRQMGGSLLVLLADLGHPLPEALPLAWPAAWAWASVALQVAEREMVEGYLYGWVANQLSAAVRLVPLGPTRAQILQQRLLPQIVDVAEQLSAVHPHELWNSGVGVSMAQLAHAELYSRLFRS